MGADLGWASQCGAISHRREASRHSNFWLRVDSVEGVIISDDVHMSEITARSQTDNVDQPYLALLVWLTASNIFCLIPEHESASQASPLSLLADRAPMF